MTTQPTKRGRPKKPFVLKPELEGILLNLTLNKKEYGLTLTHIIDWHSVCIDGVSQEQKILVYVYKNNRYAYIKVRKFVNGCYDHWTTEKAMPITTLTQLEEMLKAAVNI